MQLFSLFPTAVGSFQLDRSLTKKELTLINKFEKRPNSGNQTSVDNYVFKQKQLQSLHNFCLESANQFFQEIWKPKKELSLYITQSWVNYTAKGQFHHKHAHPNSFISGVFYISANPELDKIFFYNGFYSQYQQIKIFPIEYNQYNSESWWLPVSTGQLMLFPSSLEHMVESVISDSERISLSFNTFLRGPIGENQSLTELVIS
jgi:uncharacterized protein (TIGR02466 family)